MLLYVHFLAGVVMDSHGHCRWAGIILLPGNDYYDYIIIPQQCP